MRKKQEEREAKYLNNNSVEDKLKNQIYKISLLSYKIPDEKKEYNKIYEFKRIEQLYEEYKKIKNEINLQENILKNNDNINNININNNSIKDDKYMVIENIIKDNDNDNEKENNKGNKENKKDDSNKENNKTDYINNKNQNKDENQNKDVNKNKNENMSNEYISNEF